MEDYLYIKYEETCRKLKEEQDAVLRPHKAAYEAEEALMDKAIYIPGDKDGEALLKRIKQMRKPRSDNYERYQKATTRVVSEYHRKVCEAYRDYRRKLAEFRALPQ